MIAARESEGVMKMNARIETQILPYTVTNAIEGIMNMTAASILSLHERNNTRIPESNAVQG